MNELVRIVRGKAKSGSAERLVELILNLSRKVRSFEIIDLFSLMFRSARATKHFSCATKPFSISGADVRKQPAAITPSTNGGRCPPPIAGDRQMRTTSLILAFAFMLAGPSMAGSSDQNLPGVGTFAYQGSPVAIAAPIIVAAK